MLRHNDIAGLQQARGLPSPVTGHSTGLVECEVVTVHSDGTLDAKALRRASVTIAARYPRWYEPALGDRVILGELQGDERLRVVIQAMSTKTGAPPKVVT